MPVNIPEEASIATIELLLLTHAPFNISAVIVSDVLSQIIDGPLRVISLYALTLISVDCGETQLKELVKVKFALPAPTAVTTPILLIIATSVSLLIHEPPEVGVK